MAKTKQDPPMFDLTDKTILVTGSSKGIGAEIVAALGRQGANVIAHYGHDRKGAVAATPIGCGNRRWPGGAASTCW
jgi:NAD(P)-dependent dehydrogenase (short-subunit alcohol dehydrogenase family)